MTVYFFIDHVSLDWMDGVKTIAYDKISDFQEAFEEKFSHIQPVFDFFHLLKKIKQGNNCSYLKIPY